MRVEQLLPAEPGWRAVFAEPDGGESQSRVIGWAVVVDGDDTDLAGLIVDPSEPTRIVPAAEAGTPDGGTFVRYRYVEPKPAPPPPPPPPPEPAQAAEQLAKGFLKRRR